MPSLKSAAEDLQHTTLRAISGILRRLQYLAGLRDDSGAYKHWGLSRMYGESAASKAIGEAHFSATSEVLSTPLRALVEEIRTSADTDRADGVGLLDSLKSQGSLLLPVPPSPVAERHLNSVLRALSLVLKHRR